MIQLYGEDLLEMYLLEHQEEQAHIRETTLEGEPEIMCSVEMMFRWIAWMLNSGYITQEKHDAGIAFLREIDAKMKEIHHANNPME
jgi:hypothetical protein